jgi:PAS domain S-box-containing protein
MKLLKKVKSIIYSDEKDFSLENRLFLSSLAVGTLTSFVGAIVNFIIATSKTAYIIPFVLSGFLLCLYIFLRLKKNIETYIFPVIIIALFGISVIWIFNGGINGSNIMPGFVILILSLIVVSDRKKRFIISLFLILNIAIYLIQLYRPDLVTNYQSEKERWIDSIITLIYCSLFIYLIIKFLHKHYTLERIKGEQGEERFHNLFNHSIDGIRISDSNGIIIDQNESMSKITGISTESVIGKPVWDVLYQLIPNERQTPVRYARLKELSEKFLSTGVFPRKESSLEHQLKCNDGTIKDVESTHFSVKTETGFLLYSIVHDITERKKSEKELIKAKEKAEESDQLKSAFLENISHEIRTPMNSILGYSELILEPALPFEVRKQYSSVLQKSTDQLLTIVDNTITMAQLETKQLQIFRMQFLPEELLTGLFREYNSQKHIIGKSHIELVLNNPEIVDVKINSDYTRINQILKILLDNAFKFTDRGTITFGCNFSDNKINFYVDDTGIGIPEDKQKIIFKSFTQSDKSIRQSFGGLGVGLSIASGLVQLLDGEIIIDSQEGLGTKVVFSIPV